MRYFMYRRNGTILAPTEERVMARVRLLVERVGTARHEVQATAILLPDEEVLGTAEGRKGEDKRALLQRTRAACHKRLQTGDIDFIIADLTESVGELEAGCEEE